MGLRSAMILSVVLHVVVLVGTAIALGSITVSVPRAVRVESVRSTTPAHPSPREAPDPVIEENPAPERLEVVEEPPEFEFETVDFEERLLPEQLIEPIPPPPVQCSDDVWMERVLPPEPEPETEVEPEAEPVPEPPEPAEPAAPPAAEPTARVIEAVEGANVPPTYPAIALRRRWEGEVLVCVEVDERGAVVRCEVARSSGHAILDNAAVAAVRKWRFRHGPGRDEVAVQFVLR